MRYWKRSSSSGGGGNSKTTRLKKSHKYDMETHVRTLGNREKIRTKFLVKNFHFFPN